MLKRIWLFSLILLFALSYNAHAQQVTPIKENCLFASGSAELSLEAKNMLDNLAQKALDAGDYQISVAGFTDADGSILYNQKLSESRATNIRNYLINKGLIIEKTRSAAFGESQPLASNEVEDGKAQNRRVEINATLTNYSSFDEIVKKQEELAQEQFVVNPFEPNTLDLAQGTTIDIPANAFCFEDGSEPQKGILLSFVEAYNYADMVLFNLSTTSNGNMLETGGMIKISASSEGKTLQLKKDKSIDITMPTKKFKEDMQLFNSVTDAKGNVNWIPRGQRVKRKALKKVTAYYDLDKSMLDLVAWTLPTQPKIPEFGPLPNEPVKPRSPTKPRKPSESKYALPSKPIAEMTRKERKNWEKQEEKNEAQKRQYALLMQNYEKNLARYENDKAVFEKNLWPKYLQAKATYDVEFKQRKQIVINYVQAMSDFEASKLILAAKTRLVKGKISDKTRLDVYSLYEKMPTTTLGNKGYSVGAMIIEKAFGRAADSLNLYDIYNYSMQSDAKPNMKTNNRCGEYVDYSSFGSLVISKVNDFARLSKLEMAMDNLAEQRGNQYKALLAKRLENGNATSDEMSSYVLSTTQLNWINCDRFYNIPETQKTIVKVKEQDDIKCYILFKDTKSIMNFNAYEDFYRSQAVPKNSAVSIVAIKMKNGKAHFAKLDTEVGKMDVYNLAFEPCTTADLVKKIGLLN